MKRNIFLIAITALLLSSCIRENMDGCDTYINLTFLHDNSAEQFDNIIGNDVQVYLYKDDALCQSFRVPFEEIRGGRKYRISKTFDGGFHLVAWAVPRNGNERIIPTPEEHPYFSTAVIGHKDLTRNTPPHCSSLDDLYLGVVKEYNDNTQPDADYKVPMKNTVCKVKVFVESTLLGKSSVHGEPNVHFRGTAQGETLDMEFYGDEVCAKANLDQQTTDGMITANTIGLMPAYDNNNLSLTAKSGDVTVFSVATGERSEPGKEITILIRGLTAEIRVNGWKVKTTTVIFN